jgi:carbon monoxide dehydrogenase subunit G
MHRHVVIAALSKVQILTQTIACMSNTNTKGEEITCRIAIDVHSKYVQKAQNDILLYEGDDF